MKALLTILFFIECGLVTFSVIGCGMAFMGSSGTLPDTAAGHYMMSAVYFMLAGSLISSIIGTVLGLAGGIVGIVLKSRLRTLLLFALAIVSGVIWNYLLNCGI